MHIGRDGRSIDNSLNMWKEALTTVTPAVWKNSIRHTEEEIMKWYNREQVMDREEIQPLIICVDCNCLRVMWDSLKKVYSEQD